MKANDIVVLLLYQQHQCADMIDSLYIPEILNIHKWLLHEPCAFLPQVDLYKPGHLEPVRKHA